MSLESFIGSEQSEGMSAASLEQLREKMRKASAQIAAIKKEEKKRKKKEDELQKILLKFIQSTHKSELVLLISRVLEQNIPANFVLALVLLGNEEIQAAVGNVLLLPEAAIAAEVAEAAAQREVEAGDSALIFFDAKDQSLPLRLKIEMDNWIKNILSEGHESPHKLIATAWKKEFIQDEEGEKQEHKSLKLAISNLAAHVLEEFLAQHKVEEPKEKLQEFCYFILTGILNKVEEELGGRAFLE